MTANVWWSLTFVFLIFFAFNIIFNINWETHENNFLSDNTIIAVVLVTFKNFILGAVRYEHSRVRVNPRILLFHFYSFEQCVTDNYIKSCDLAVKLLAFNLWLLFQDHWAGGFETGQYEFSGIYQQRTEESGPTGSLDDYKSQDSLLPHWFPRG